MLFRKKSVFPIKLKTRIKRHTRICWHKKKPSISDGFHFFRKGYKSIQSKIPPVSKSFQYIVPSSIRMYEWGVSSLGRETEPQFA